MDKNRRLESEKEFHNETFSKNTRAAVKKYYRAANTSKEKYRTLISEDIRDKKVLEYGCGPGSAAFDLAKLGANVTAIDISDVAIEMAQKKAAEEGLNIAFHVMDAEDLDFEKDTFDLICGSGILHHLNLEESYKELNRTLQPNGKAIFFEPLGHNPVINIYRTLTPKMRTDDEHPLLMEDIEKAKSYFSEVKTFHFNLTSTAASFLPFLSNSLQNFDEWLFKNIPGLKKYSWIVVLQFSKPIKT
ncbi:MAG: class I SAM-dependent methyltransferase [Candidatus Paceibacterota bacterium]